MAPPVEGTRGHAFRIEGLNSISAGLISDVAMVGIGSSIVNVLIG
jgi:hypothetical protein